MTKEIPDIDVKISRPNFAPYQEDFLYNGKRFTVTEASTKCGKTFAHIFWIFERAHEDWNKDGYNHWWIAPVYRQAKIAFKRLKKKVLHKTGYTVFEGALTIRTPLGSNIVFLSAQDPDTLYGEDVYSVVFDEAPRAKVEAHYAIRSTLTATKGVYKLIGNFGGVSNWVHQLKEKAREENSEYAYYRITAYDAVEAGILDEAEIEQAKLDLPPKIFKELYLATATESDDMMISYSAMNDLFTNDHVKKGTKYITADIALHGSDLFVIAVWYGFQVVEWIEIEKAEAEDVELTLKNIARKHGVMRSKIIYDSDGLGSFLRSYLKGATGFVNNGKVSGKENYANIKAQCAYKLAKMINDGEVWIQGNEYKKEIMSELEMLKSKTVGSGKMGIVSKDNIKKELKRSPDRLDTLIMRMLPEVKPRRSLSVRVN